MKHNYVKKTSKINKQTKKRIRKCQAYIITNSENEEQKNKTTETKNNRNANKTKYDRPKRIDKFK